MTFTNRNSVCVCRRRKNYRRNWQIPHSFLPTRISTSKPYTYTTKTAVVFCVRKTIEHFNCSRSCFDNLFHISVRVPPLLFYSVNASSVILFSFSDLFLFIYSISKMRNKKNNNTKKQVSSKIESICMAQPRSTSKIEIFVWRFQNASKQKNNTKRERKSVSFSNSIFVFEIFFTQKKNIQ